MREYVLVGSGIAALSAAEAIRAADAAARVTLVSREPHPFYSRPGLAYYLTGQVPERRLHLRRAAEIEQLRLRRVSGDAVKVDRALHQVQLRDGRTVAYDRLLLAPGAASLVPRFPGADADGVLRLDGLDDARRFTERAQPGRTAVVIGGGSTALELVEACVARGLRTHYLLRGERYWPRVLDAAESALVATRLRVEGVQLHPSTEIARALVSRRGRLRGVETTRGERIACDLLACAIGVQPRFELATASGLAVDRGILANEHLTTSDPDVFVAGDAAQVVDADGGGGRLDTLWSSAAAQGALAGRNMAGAREAQRATLAMNVTLLAGIETTIVGAVGECDDLDLLTITRGQSERWRGDARGRTLRSAAEHSRVRIVLGADAIVGAVVMGDQSLSRPLARLVADRVPLGGLRERLLAEPLRLRELIAHFFDDWQARRAA